MMPTQEEIDRAEAIIEKYTSWEDPTPLEPEQQEWFQRRCAKEAERLRYFLTKLLSKKARAEVTKWERTFAKSAVMNTVPEGLVRTIAPHMNRTLTSYRTGDEQSYVRRPKGKIYERL